jgi:tryptophan synthase beta chain
MHNNNGFYGDFGGQFSAETLIPALDELQHSFEKFLKDEKALKELDVLLKTYAGRPTPVYYARALSKKYGVEIYLKREDLLHTGAHKINNSLGQAFFTRHMNKKRIIAETGAGQHGVATATAAALLNLDCTIYMGRVDAERQMPNVKKMKLLGAKVVLVDDGQKTLKDAVSAAMRDWVASVETTHYLIGSVVGPHPFPRIVSWFQRVIGDEAREQMIADNELPDAVVACVGGGSNAIGIFQAFIDDASVSMIGVEAGGRSINAGDHSATLALGTKGIFQGALSYMLQNEYGIVDDVHSVSAGLDYPGVGPQHSFLKDSGRVVYDYVFDKDALRAFKELTQLEGIIPALESSHAVAYVLKNADSLKGKKVLINLSGRGDKDLGIIDTVNLEEL